MKKKIIRDISTNSLQTVINQFCGFVIFYVISIFISKNDFGEINWALAVLLTAFSILSFGIDQVAVKKIAGGENANIVLSTYLFHVLLTGILFYGFLLVTNFVFPTFFQHHRLLLILGIGKMMIFFSTPFKQLANGLEKFRSLFYMSVFSNVIRSLAFILLSLFSQVNLTTVIIIFVTGDIAELLLSVFITKNLLKFRLSIKTSKPNYFNLLKESLPQVGVVIFTSAIARFDWIFLGIFASNIALAEYSFAFKVFEVAMLPLLVIAPILIPRFTKLFNGAGTQAIEKITDLTTLLRFEIIISSLGALMLNILWAPTIDFITHNKYGLVNHYTILILSMCMPFVYVNNFLWTFHFAKGKLKMIFYIFLITFLVNIAGDVILIPLYGKEGAASAYLLAIIIQFILFLKKTIFPGLTKNMWWLLICPAAAFASGGVSILLFDNVLLISLFALLFFFSSLIFTRILRLNDLTILKRVTGL